MIALSKNEFNVVGFLIRNFSKRFTIRNIASELNISPAGAHAVLKNLEKDGVVKAEKFGTGLFYYIDLDNKIAQHLAAIGLLDYADVKPVNIPELEKESRAAVFDGKKLIVVTSSIENAKDICYKYSKGIEAICKTEEEFVEALRNKEKEVLEILEKGNVLFGEELIINAIKKVTR